MKPVGIERDKQIAYMRGEESYHNYKHANKPYSTDISCAMELAEDMRDNGNYDAVQLLKEAFVRWVSSHEEAEDLPGEISGAWIRWKEGE